MNNWPEYSCVLPFVYESLQRLGHNASPSEVASRLSIVVPKETNNKYGFKTSYEKHELGYNQDNANAEINSILEFSNKHIFRLIKLNRIPYQQYYEVIEDLLEKKMIVGIGYNYCRIKNKNSLKVSKHLSFIDKIGAKNLTLLDYYIDDKGITFNSTYELIVRAALEVDGSLWVIGVKTSLDNILNKYGIRHDEN